MKVLVATEKPFAEIASGKIKELIDAAGYEAVFLENYKSAAEFSAAVSDADALIVRSDIVSAELLDAAKRLKIVVRAGAGYDNLDLEACTRHKVVAMNTPGQNSNAVAELAFEMMLYIARGGFAGKSGTELRGKTIGIHGFGNVGRYVAEISKGFGMTASAFDPYVAGEVIAGHGIKVCKSAHELYSGCEYISLNIPFNKETGASVNFSLLSVMPAPAVLVNTARKEIISEESLLKMFAERPDFRYLSDVAPDCKALLEEKYSGRFLFTAKKMGAQTEEANSNAGIAAISQIVDYFNTGNERFRLNK